MANEEIFRLLSHKDLMITFLPLLMLDEDWFTLDANLLREALEITPIDQAHPFVSPPSGDAIMDFVNELGYSEEEFTIFIKDQYLRFILLKKTSLDNLKFVCKGKIDEVFGMPIPNEPISNNIRHVIKLQCYLKWCASIIKLLPEKGGKKKSASTKQPKPKPAIEKSSKPAPTSKPKVTKEKTSKASTAKPPKLKPTNEKSTKATPYYKKPASKVSKFVTRTSTTDEASTGPSAQPLDDTSANIIYDYPSLGDTETGARSDKISNGGDTKIVQITEELGEDVEKQKNVKEKMVELDQD
ncbi:hypothetical protein Tco_0975182 [Tanacetum coccineum]|uniref:Uncharacterized protein n=1 Tax=Tanacetum coccineum TaxID=301880 RepID=A0ABQ5EDP3_9ASTR